MQCPKCKDDHVSIEDFEFDYKEQKVTEYFYCESCKADGSITSYMVYDSHDIFN